MSFSIFKITNKYCIKLLFSFLPLNKCYKISKSSQKLFEILGITVEKYKILNEIHLLINPSYDINKYISYIDKKHVISNYKNKNININESQCIYKQLLFGELSEAAFNVDLFLENETWIDIINQIKNWRLNVSQDMIDFLFNLEDKRRKNLLFILNMFKNNLKEISFSNCLLNDNDIIDRIMFILKKIFEIEKEKDYKKINIKNEINNSQENNKQINNSDIINKNHTIKKIVFKNNKLSFFNKFFSELSEIIYLNIIEEFIIDDNSLSAYQFGDMMTFISKYMTSLKYLKIINLAKYEINYKNFKNLFFYYKENIERIELKDIVNASEIIPILNIKKYPLKELKINLFSREKGINFDFLKKNINTIEILEIELVVNNIKKNIDKIIPILNEMTNLKRLKIIGGLEPGQMLNFTNFTNIEYLYFDIIINNDNYYLYKNKMLYYFINFKNLKSLYLIKRISFININKFYNFDFPPNLKILGLINIDGNSLMDILHYNNKHLINIEEFKIERISFKYHIFDYFIGILNYFKSLSKLSINKIIFVEDSYKYSNFDFVDCIKIICKIVQSLIELDISNNNINNNEKLLNKLLELKFYLPSKLICLKLFDDNLPIKYSKVSSLLCSFNEILDSNNKNVNIIYDEELKYNNNKKITFKSNNLKCNFSNFIENNNFIEDNIDLEFYYL